MFLFSLVTDSIETYGTDLEMLRKTQSAPFQDVFIHLPELTLHHPLQYNCEIKVLLVKIHTDNIVE